MLPHRFEAAPARLRRLLPAALLLGVALVALAPGAGAQGPGVDLEVGWNNVPYEGEPLPVEEALGSVAPAIEGVWGWRAAEAVWLVSIPGDARLSSLRALETGAAYWLRSSAALRWDQPAEVQWERALLAVERESGGTLLLAIELADTPARRSRGLMFRQFLDEEVGMLFLFPAETQGGFWMRNALVPLSIAFIDGEGVINGIRDMEPEDETVVRPAAAYRWALEVNQGWFQANGVGRGDQVRLTGS